MMAFNKQPHKLSVEQADTILTNVLDIVGEVPNTVPLEALESYSHYRAERFTFKRFLVCLILIAFLLVPVAFIAPSISLEHIGTTNGKAEYVATVNSVLPITSVTAKVDNNNVPVYEVADNKYRIMASTTGKLTVKASCANTQYQAESVDIFAERKDKESPKLVDNKVVGENIVLYLTDKGSGIDYTNIYALTEDGKKIEPLSFNNKDATVTFRNIHKDMNIFVGDAEGNVLQLVLTIQ